MMIIEDDDAAAVGCEIFGNFESKSRFFANPRSFSRPRIIPHEYKMADEHILHLCELFPSLDIDQVFAIVARSPQASLDSLVEACLQNESNVDDVSPSAALDAADMGAAEAVSMHPAVWRGAAPSAPPASLVLCDLEIDGAQLSLEALLGREAIAHEQARVEAAAVALSSEAGFASIKTALGSLVGERDVLEFSSARLFF